jgi:aspartyl-tRNA(Asn)/glutamyl-tRNA(Gln) amidotransferase subunit B
MNYEATIGLETHVQLKTNTKIFCGCANEFGAPPNTNVCPVCLGMPGVLPVPNEEAIRKTALTGMVLNCEISRYSKFDRKNYFYPDMPKNYQISQYDRPLCVKGVVEFEFEGKIERVGITRVHLEEDVGKNFHFATTSGVDFNRAGVPLMEIVSEPDMSGAAEAFAYLNALKDILIYAGVSDCDMEKGMVRCDVNVSVRPVGQKELGRKIEIKNMNSFSGVRNALEYEIKRQIEAVQKGEKLVQETRRWDDVGCVTETMRTKEMAHDYRYFPDPDLMPFVANDEWLDNVKKAMPELPMAKKNRFMQQYQLPAYDAGVLSADLSLSLYFEKAMVAQASLPVSGTKATGTEASATKNGKAVANWIINDLLRDLTEAKKIIDECPIQPEHIGELIALQDSGKISSKIAKDVFVEMFKTSKAPGAIVEEKGLLQVSDTGAIEAMVDEAIKANPQVAADYKAGNVNAINRLKGAVMKASKGKANPALVDELLKKKLA